MTPQEAATELVQALRAFDGTPPDHIRSINITPDAIVLETYEVDPDGHKFLTDGAIATATRKIPFSYRP